MVKSVTEELRKSHDCSDIHLKSISSAPTLQNYMRNNYEFRTTSNDYVSWVTLCATLLPKISYNPRNKTDVEFMQALVSIILSFTSNPSDDLRNNWGMFKKVFSRAVNVSKTLTSAICAKLKNGM